MNFQDWLSHLANNPLFISASSISLCFAYVLVIFSKTSLGKKLFNKAKSSYDEALKEKEETLENLKETIEAKESEIKELTYQYENRLNVLLCENVELEKLLDKIGEVSPNLKIKNALEEFKNSREERLNKINEVFTYLNFDLLKEKAEESDRLIEEAKKAVEASYGERLDKLEELLGQLQKKEEEGHL